jgi:hypothetical protein
VNSRKHDKSRARPSLWVGEFDFSWRYLSLNTLDHSGCSGKGTLGCDFMRGVNVEQPGVSAAFNGPSERIHMWELMLATIKNPLYGYD